MKTPSELARQLAKQWQIANHRETRLLTGEPWPLLISIGKPTASQFAQSTTLRQHLQQWREVTVGDVEWQPVSYRGASEAVELPLYWKLNSPSEWVAATGDKQVRAEYQQLGQLVQGLDVMFHRTVIRQRHLVLEKPVQEVIQAGELALQLNPGCAEGKPLRALSLVGIDSKFFERHRHLIIQFLDLRFDGAVSARGLEVFLGAADGKDHWLLIAPLVSGSLHFQQQRVRSRELMQTPLPADGILVVENERCLHQLPQLPNIIAILGAGLHLNWMQADWLNEKNIAYWGDMDSWGLKMLVQARGWQPELTPLLMNRAVFEQYAHQAVVEPNPVESTVTEGLTAEEAAFYQYLLSRERGRLEQEFLPGELVAQVIREWQNSWLETSRLKTTSHHRPQI